LPSKRGVEDSSNSGGTEDQNTTPRQSSHTENVKGSDNSSERKRRDDFYTIPVKGAQKNLEKAEWRKGGKRRSDSYTKASEKESVRKT